MKTLEYADNEIGNKEVAFAVNGMVLGYGILTLPRAVIAVTKSFDGWISIFLGSLIALGFAWVIALLIRRFPRKGLRDIAAAITNKTTANVVTLLFAGYLILFASYETRGVASVSKLYLFDRTPEEAISLVFLWVVIYGVAGTSISLLRINLLFLPLVLIVILLVILMNFADFEYHNLKPFFITDWKDIVKATKETGFSFLGIEILLVYNIYINQYKNTVKAVMVGLLIPALIYLLVFISAVGVFSAVVVENIMYPTAELAKQVEIPGGFFERVESIFFMVWVLALFNTTAMALDVALLAVSSVFPKLKRMTITLVLSPIIYLLAMQPQNFEQIHLWGQWISYMGIGMGWLLPLVLLIIAKLRGVKGNA